MTDAVSPPADQASSKVTVMTAKRFHTLEPGFPTAEAVALRDGRILSVGTLDEVTATLADTPFTIDQTLADHVVVPGLIDQHLHPLLGATTLAMEVIATEDWALPGHTYPAATWQPRPPSPIPVSGFSPGATTRCGTARLTVTFSTRSAALAPSACGIAAATSST
jgi:hypothetical protein